MTSDQLRRVISWHSRYDPAQDQDPWHYLNQRMLPPGRSRRLGVLTDSARGFKAYLGVQHFDPALWGNRGIAYCKFFVSLWIRNTSLELRTYSTMQQALERLQTAYSAVTSVQKGRKDATP